MLTGNPAKTITVSVGRKDALVVDVIQDMRDMISPQHVSHPVLLSILIRFMAAFLSQDMTIVKPKHHLYGNTAETVGAETGKSIGRSIR